MWRIKYWFRKHIKYPLQRMSRGYADEDLFNINWWFLTTVGKMLCELSKCNCAYPGTDKYPTNESWQADLEKYGKLALKINDDDFYWNKTKNGFWKDFRFEEYAQDKEDFFNWFKENFEDLWD